MFIVELLLLPYDEYTSILDLTQVSLPKFDMLYFRMILLFIKPTIIFEMFQYNINIMRSTSNNTHTKGRSGNILIEFILKIAPSTEQFKQASIILLYIIHINYYLALSKV